MSNDEYGSVVVNPIKCLATYIYRIYIDISAEDSKLSK